MSGDWQSACWTKEKSVRYTRCTVRDAVGQNLRRVSGGSGANQRSIRSVPCSGRRTFEFLHNDNLMDLVEGLVGPEIICSPIQHLRPKLPSRLVAGYHSGASHVAAWHQDAGVTMEDARPTLHPHRLDPPDQSDPRERLYADHPSNAKGRSCSITRPFAGSALEFAKRNYLR